MRLTHIFVNLVICLINNLCMFVVTFSRRDVDFSFDTLGYGSFFDNACGRISCF